jgi:hypothetical protein
MILELMRGICFDMYAACATYYTGAEPYTCDLHLPLLMTGRPL